MLSKKIRLLAFALSMITIFSTLSGCGEKNNEDDAGNANNGKSESKIEFLVDPEDYRGTTVKYATWKDPKANEDGPVIETFEKKYGINVEIQLLDQGSYVNSIAASIAAFSASVNSEPIVSASILPSSLRANAKDIRAAPNTIKLVAVDFIP